MGSVKDLQIIKKADGKKAGIGRFVFSDRYSVFDWGEMPDRIDEKGKAICIATSYFFEKLEEEGIKSHYIGIVEEDKVKRLYELKSPQNTMEFKLFNVIKPEIKGNNYDYSIYRNILGNFLIPLEVIYRNSLPEGSSVFKRLRDGSLSLDDIGLKEFPEPGKILEKEIIDVSTKLESTDRYISWEEAKKICALNDNEVDLIKETTKRINKIITEEVKKIGLFNEDGKVEFGFDENRELVLVDALGTLDECRFTYEGLPVSKEIARIYYRKTNWYYDVENAKKIDKVNWKKYVKSTPERLPERLKIAISDIYKAYANELTKRKWFEVPSLIEILKGIKEFLERD